MVISSLSSGGAERVLVLVARGLTALGHRVSIVTIFGKEDDFYAVPEGVDRVALALGGTTRTALEKTTTNTRRVFGLRRALRQIEPDVVISFMTETNVLALLAGGGKGVPIFVTEHADPAKIGLVWIWKQLSRLVYRRASRLVSVSAAVDDSFAWLPEAKRAVIPNPISFAEVEATAAEPLPKPWPRTVAAMGRLESEKGFDLLINAFARLADDFPDWGLLILGEGSLLASLESLAAEHGLSGRVRLPGVVENPFPTLKQSDLFVLSSRSEGFGNALVEAMACGLPAIATECWSTPPGLVRHDVDGLLVPAENVDALSAAMAELMGDDDRRRRLASEAVQSVKRFDLDEVAQAWDALLETVVESGQPA